MKSKDIISYTLFIVVIFLLIQKVVPLLMNYMSYKVSDAELYIKSIYLGKDISLLQSKLNVDNNIKKQFEDSLLLNNNKVNWKLNYHNQWYGRYDFSIYIKETYAFDITIWLSWNMEPMLWIHK
jgi:hypothetical protein